MENLFELEAPVFRSSVLGFVPWSLVCVCSSDRQAFLYVAPPPALHMPYPPPYFFSPASHWLGCISRGTRAPYRSYGPRRNSVEPPRGTLAKLGHPPRPHGPRPVACVWNSVKWYFYQKKLEPQTTSRHRPGAPPRTARAHRSAIVARHSSIADRPSRSRSFVRSRTRMVSPVVVCACVYTT